MYYPMMMDLENKKILVIGGGKVAYRKIKGLVETGAYIYVVGTVISPEIQAIKHQKLILIERSFMPSDLENKDIAFVCTNSRETNERLVDLAKSKGLLTSCVEQKVHADFIVPAVYRNGDLTVAVSTSGANPTLAKNIRDEIASQYEGNYSERVELLKELRQYIINTEAEETRHLMLKELAALDIEVLRERRSKIED